MTKRLKNKNYVNKIRHGSPKLQEVLREKCRQRMREKRDQLFNRYRFGSELESRNVQDTLTEIIRQEFKNLATSDDGINVIFKTIDEPIDLELAIELEDELIQEQEQWILQEYEKMSQDEVESLARYADGETNEIFCPICQKVILKEENNYIICNMCGLRLIDCSLEQVRYSINENINIHALNCTETPIFMVIPDNNHSNLYMICHNCSTLALVC